MFICMEGVTTLSEARFILLNFTSLISPGVRVRPRTFYLQIIVQYVDECASIFGRLPCLGHSPKGYFFIHT